MGRSPCCEKVGLKKGPWTPEEDQKLLSYIEEHGHGSWRALPTKAGLERCGKSCRLRWTNYLRPDIKRGKFTSQEEQTIIQLHALLGNRWSAIATHLPKRTDNEIKNYWNTHLKKRLTKMGIDPITHKPKNETLFSDNHSKNAANLSHMAQWESARLEAEARLVRESKLRSQYSLQIGSNNSVFPSQSSSSASSSSNQVLNIKEEGEKEWKGYEDSTHLLEFKEVMENSSIAFTSTMTSVAEDGFTNLLLDNSNSGDPSLSPESGGECNTCDGSGSGGGGSGSDFYEDNKNYWNNILNLVNSSPSNSPMF
ncbi:hypothetical protein P8452_63665 [Trifolium repens]|nr:transcription factor MYB106 [Trifolium repens]WJX80703.1 hypothetical protein P8452_63665 [Trifolium repens]